MTYLKKVEGDAQALKQNLAEQLSLRPDQIRLNPVTGHIQISVRAQTTSSAPLSHPEAA